MQIIYNGNNKKSMGLYMITYDEKRLKHKNIYTYKVTAKIN